MTSLFQKAERRASFLKMGIMGFAGSGKTYTGSLVAIGLAKAAIKKQMPYAGRPVFFVDTEGGSDYVVDEFERAGVELVVARTRAFADLKAAMAEAEKGASVLIIDSITHFWTEWQEAYKAGKNRRRGLEFSDWGEVKGQWRKSFTEPYLNSNLHIIMCARASWEYDHFTDDAGKKQIEKSGIKMSAEKEMGFEPSLLVYMEHDQDPDTHKVTRKAYVMKDRFRNLDGEVIENPTFKSFVPHIEKLNWGGDQGGVDTSRTSEAMVEPDQWDRRKTDRDIVLDEINALLSTAFSTSQADKKAKNELLEAAFGTVSMTEIEKRISLEELQTAYDKCHRQLKGTASRYDRGDPADVPSNDEIPALANDEPPVLAAAKAAEPKGKAA